MTCEIIRAKSEDAERIAPLFDAYRQFYHRPSDVAAARAFVAERLASSESVIFLAADSKAAALGFAQMYETFTSVDLGRLWLLNDLWVEIAARGRGVGRALVERCVEHARATGAARIQLETRLDNAAARALYASAGWEFVDGSCLYNFWLEKM